MKRRRFKELPFLFLFKVVFLFLCEILLCNMHKTKHINSPAKLEC